MRLPATLAGFLARISQLTTPRAGMRRLLRVAGWLLLGAYFVLALLVLALRYWVLPQVERYRPEVEQAVSAALKLPVRIGALASHWHGLRPGLRLSGLEVRDAAGHVAFVLDDVEAEFAWSSLIHLEPRLHRFEIGAPQLEIRRDGSGRLFVAGLELRAESSEGDFSDWLLAQDRIVVRDAAITWHDELRGAPPLALTHLNFDLRNDGNRHRFGFTAEPPAHLAARLDIRGDFRGDDLDAIEAWKGQAYAELDYADLAGWRSWIDYPIELPQGEGGLRLWLGFAAKRLTSLTADVRLANLRVRLAPELPMLDLERLEGRLGGRLGADHYEADVRQLGLATRGGLAIAPADVHLRWHPPAGDGRPAAGLPRAQEPLIDRLRHWLANPLGSREARGEFAANGLDLGALAALAGYLPLDAEVRRGLAEFAPRGRIFDFKASWTGDAPSLRTWNVKGRFDELGLAAHGVYPGFAGLSGSIAGGDKGGTLELDSRRAMLEMPGVFADPRLELEALSAKAGWKRNQAGLDMQLLRANFKNRDATGEASGHYRTTGTTGTGLGDIDLSARLTHASGEAVWRYMPLVVNKDVRDWLRNAIVGGEADETTLRLKGDLAQFPFRDGKSGIFQVKGRFRGADLRFATDWPEIRDIDGELLFEGARMLIRGHKGRILGAEVRDVSAEIADLEATEEIMRINGKASGPTMEFLKFIEASPVGARIDHFTEHMAAQGDGELNLALTMPLRRVASTQVAGRYRFAANQLTVDPDLMPLTNVNGELRFTGDRLEAQKIRAVLLGAPMTVDVATAGDGVVTVKAAGTLAVRELRQQFGHPLFEHLSGAAPWQGTIRVRKKTTDVRFESALAGIASSLPEPFNKSATETRLLVFERRAAPEPARPVRSGAEAGAPRRDQLLLTLGDALQAQLIRRHEAGGVEIERGALAIGAAVPRLPERGVALALQTPTLDLDFWRRLANGNGAATNGKRPPLPFAQADLRTDELVAFGRAWHDVRLHGTREGEVWRAEVRSRDLAGNVEWSGEGTGRLTGRLAKLSIPEGTGETPSQSQGELPKELPSLDFSVARFLLRGKELGELRLRADSRDGAWNARVDIRNDDGTLAGEGRWRRGDGSQDSALQFKLTAKSIERLLARLGYPEAVRRGSASLEGDVSWQGAPFAIDYPSLSGSVKVEAANGQFNKLEPGVGRLLGVISLQSLPRRLTLDFRDIFSEGFAFDGISGSASIKQGVMETQNLEIVGPAARVLMSGSANLAAETQDLKVRVQPAVGETIATGAMIAHPAAGAVAWLAQKILKDPLGQVFAFEYRVTGSWADPKVEKLSGPPPAETPVQSEAKP